MKALMIVFALLVSSSVYAQQVQLLATLNGASKPSIVGMTNLPEGTELGIQLVCPTMYCPVFWASSTTDSTFVHNGQFVSKPYDNNGAPLPNGRYVINVVVVAIQSQSVAEKLSQMGCGIENTCAYHFEATIPK